MLLDESFLSSPQRDARQEGALGLEIEFAAVQDHDR